MLDATADLKEVFTQAVVDGDVGRQLYASPELIKDLKEKSLRDTVLVGARNEWFLYRSPI